MADILAGRDKNSKDDVFDVEPQTGEFGDNQFWKKPEMYDIDELLAEQDGEWALSGEQRDADVKSSEWATNSHLWVFTCTLPVLYMLSLLVHLPARQWRGCKLRSSFRATYVSQTDDAPLCEIYCCLL